LIQSPIENAEEDALRPESTTRESSSGVGGYCKNGEPPEDRAFKGGGRGESKNGDWSSRKGPSSKEIPELLI
jgi:hypothetical protein